MQRKIRVETRATKRSPCRLESKIRYFSETAEARMLDVSRGGMSLEILGRLHASTGSRVFVENADIGLVEATVRWRRHGRLGLQIKQTTNSRAQIASYFRHFHRDLRLSRPH